MMKMGTQGVRQLNWGQAIRFSYIVSSLTVATLVQGQVTQLPTISPLADISMLEFTMTNVQFLVSTPDVPLASLTIQAASTNETLIPSKNLTFYNSGTNLQFGLPSNTTDPETSSVRLNLVPNAFYFGESDIVITLTAAGPRGTNVVTTRFHLVVKEVVYHTTFNGSDYLEVLPGDVVGPLNLQIPGTNLTVTVHSSDPTLVSDSNIVLTQTLETNFVNCTLTIATEATAPYGSNVMIWIVATASDNQVPYWEEGITLHFLSPPRSWSNATPILIADNSIAAPYPSLINVDALQGRISKTAVTLNGFSHTSPQDTGVLLVAPSGKSLVLMNGAGGNLPVQSLNLTFKQDAQIMIPQTGPLTNGTYRPTNNKPNLTAFATPAPAGPYTNTSLEAFDHESPNGVWSLYVQDFALTNAGAISNGWSLTISTEPVINGLQDISGGSLSALSQRFTVGDDSSLERSYFFTATSDNPTVVTNAGIIFTGSGTNWTVTIHPVPYATGSAKIDVILGTPSGQSASASFTARFYWDCAPLALAPAPDQTIVAGSMAAVPLIWDQACYPSATVSFNVIPSNTNLLPVANVKLVGTNLLVWPTGNFTGTTTITVTASSPLSTSSTINFLLNVIPSSSALFANTGTIVIRDNQAASPYPATINVSGVTGQVAKVTATLSGLSHGFPQDISVLLAGPQGQKVVLMSRAGGTSPMTNTWLTFDDTAAATLPQFSLEADGIYKPTDYKVSDTFFAPAPVAPYSHALSVFDGTDLNGTWSLYVEDDQAGDSGIISGGWMLTLQTTPAQTPHLSISPSGDWLKIQFTGGAPNTVCTLQSTVDFKAWMDITNATANAAGLAEFITQPAPTRNSQFYRVRASQ
jgi:subtilisin-like proprotein convertase family protein